MVNVGTNPKTNPKMGLESRQLIGNRLDKRSRDEAEAGFLGFYLVENIRLTMRSGNGKKPLLSVRHSSIFQLLDGLAIA
jgi:hypothetical protein